MAVYKIDVKIFSRGKGGCVTRAAAYRAGERIRDERTGAIHNFNYRDDVVHKEILIPAEFSGRADMDWARDRGTLWNSAERTGLRNARLGREVMVVLPGELSAVQRVQLARRFGQELADRGGVDVTVHLPRSGSADVGHHAHILMTARRVTPEGIGARTILELSGTELHSRGLGSSKKELLLIRERWAAVTNEAFREAGLELRIDHRSLKDRGIDREPGLVLPRKIFCMERRYGPSEVGDRFRAEYRERVEARLKGPDELACVLKKQKEEQRLPRWQFCAIPQLLSYWRSREPSPADASITLYSSSTSSVCFSGVVADRPREAPALRGLARLSYRRPWEPRFCA
jgi:hypothetical protein